MHGVTSMSVVDAHAAFQSQSGIGILPSVLPCHHHHYRTTTAAFAPMALRGDEDTRGTIRRSYAPASSSASPICNLPGMPSPNPVCHPANSRSSSSWIRNGRRRSSDADTPPSPFRSPTYLPMAPQSSEETDDDAEAEFSRFTRIDSDPSEGGEGELYDFDDEELMELLSDVDEGGVTYGIGDLLELEQILQEQLVLDEGDGWEDGFGDGEDGVGGDDDRSDSAICSPLEEALLQGVVPASAGVGSGCLPGDYDFDPLGLATKDYFKRVQNFLLMLIPPSDDDDEYEYEYDNGAERQQSPLSTTTADTTAVYSDADRPPALILRDYREAEIRHGRLAMLAAVVWPLQEILNRLFLPPESFGFTVVYGGVTLPYLSLLMTLIIMLLGYLDIYAQAIKSRDAGDAFLPGECFWDPLSMLGGASDEAKSRMQLRELENGRWAMVAVASYLVQESVTHQPLITLPWNQVLFEPAFEIPAVQAYLDYLFS